MFRHVRTGLQLTKARLSLLVVATAAAAYVVARAGAPFHAPCFLWTVAGTGLAAAGANAINQCMEAARDRAMPRTRGRPVARGAVRAGTALATGAALATAGPALLAALVDVRPALLALAAVVLYTLVYTPLKTRSPFCTLAGAVVGSIPPLIGWTAAAGSLAAGGWILAALLFAWQVPHFLSLAWLHRDEYAAAGYKMLPSVDPGGRFTFRMILLYTFALFLVAPALTLAGTAGPLFAAGSVLLGFALLGPASRLHRTGGAREARRLFLASVVYLPLLLGLLAWDRGPAGRSAAPAAAESAARADAVAR